MRFDSVIYLIALSESENEPGHPVITPTRREVLAEKRSVMQREFYEALANALRPEMIFVIWASEYNNEPLLEHDGVTYEIIRTYSGAGKKDIELTCSVQDLVKTNLARLRDEVEVWNRVSALNELSETIQRDELFAKLPAEIVPEAGSVTGQPADTTVVNVTHKIIIKYRDGVTPDMFIRFGVQRFDIRYILNPYSRNETLEIHVEELIE